MVRCTSTAGKVKVKVNGLADDSMCGEGLLVDDRWHQRDSVLTW